MRDDPSKRATLCVRNGAYSACWRLRTSIVIRIEVEAQRRRPRHR